MYEFVLDIVQVGVRWWFQITSLIKINAHKANDYDEQEIFFSKSPHINMTPFTSLHI